MSEPTTLIRKFWGYTSDLNDHPCIEISRGYVELINYEYGEPPEYDYVPYEEIIVRPKIKFIKR